MPIERKSFTGTEIRAGVMVFISGVLLLAFMAAILKYRPATGERTFYVAMTDIAGLDRSADVRFGGMVVGRVTRIGPHPTNRAQMLITAKVSQETPVNASSRAYVGQVGLTAEKHLEITTGTAEAPLFKGGETLPTTPPLGMFGDLSGLTASVQNLIADVQVLLGVSDGSGNRTLEVENTRTVADIFSRLDSTMTDLRLVMGVVDEKGEPLPAEERRTINDLMTKLDGTMVEGRALVDDVRGVLAENRQQIQDLLASANKLSASADEFVGNLDDVVADNRENIDATLTTTREAMGKLNDMMANVKALVGVLQTTLERNGPAFDDTIKTLNSTLRNLEELTRTLAEQPQAIIRGREAVGREP